MSRLVRQFRGSRNPRGEWSLADLVRGYRICRYNHEAHVGTHIHFPLDGPVIGPADVADESEGNEILRAYASRHESFDLRALQEVIAEWKSKSKSG